jgi:hypothetical protein
LLTRPIQVGVLGATTFETYASLLWSNTDFFLLTCYFPLLKKLLELLGACKNMDASLVPVTDLNDFPSSGMMFYLLFKNLLGFSWSLNHIFL